MSIDLTTPEANETYSVFGGAFMDARKLLQKHYGTYDSKGRQTVDWENDPMVVTYKRTREVGEALFMPLTAQLTRAIITNEDWLVLTRGVVQCLKS